MQSHSHSPKNAQQPTAQQPSHTQGRKKETGSDDVPGIFLQTKLTVNAPGDRYEREADAVADRILRMPNGAALTQPSLTPIQGIQRKCAACEEEEEMLQRKESASATPAITPAFSTQLSRTKGLGNPLPIATQSFMGGAIGADFSGVRVHTDEEAVSMNRQLNARAFTYGSDIYFNRGEYAPESAEGKRLLAHELSHTLQQGAVPSVSQLSRMPDPETIQRNCADLSSEFENWDPANLTPADRRRLDRRIRECALGDLERFRQILAPRPQSPRDYDAAHAARYDRLMAAIENQETMLEAQPGSLMVTSLLSYLAAVRSSLGSSKVFAYLLVINERALNTAITAVEGNAALHNHQNEALLRDVRDEVSLIRDNPDRYFLLTRVGDYYRELGVSRLTVTDGGLASDPNADPVEVPNRSAFPATMAGPQTMVKNGTGTFTMSLNYSVAGPDLLSQVVAAMNHVGYTWELYDITTLFRNRLEQRATAIRAAASSGSPVPDTTEGDLALDQATSQAPVEENEVGVMAASGRRWERFGDATLQEMEDNWEDFTNPQAGSDGTFMGDFVTSFIGEFNLATTSIGATFGALSQLISSIADLFGGVTNEKEIPFPNREGWFLVRAIATPSRTGTDDDPIIYASSVANLIVRVQDISAFTRQQRTDIAASLEARRMELEATLLQTTDPTDRARLESDLQAVRVEQTGSAVEILTSRITQLETLRDRTTDAGQRRVLEERIAELRRSLETATERESEFRTGSVIRPRAVFVSEENGQSYPLLLQLGLINEYRGEYRYRLSDLSRPDGGTYDGYGRSVSQAVNRAIIGFTRSAPYGKGLLNIVLPGEATFTLPQTEYECRTRGGALALHRLEEVATVLTVLGLLAVPYAGQVALVIGAGLAARRIFERIENHTFRWDTAAFTDVVSILGAAATGAAAIGRLRVIRTARLFAVVADDADVVRLLATMNRTASRLEMLEDFINWGGYMLGNLTTLGQLADIAANEMSGSISHAEARRQRAELMLSAVRDGVFQFAGFDANETSRRVHDSFAPIPGEGGGSHPADATPSVPVTPQPDTPAPPLVAEPPRVETIPHVEGETPVPDSSALPPAAEVPRVETVPHPDTPAPANADPAARPGDATAPPPRMRLPEASVEAHLATLSGRLGELPFALRELLIYDHVLLERAAGDATVITPENLRAWTDIGMMSPMHPDTYAMLLRNPALREALMQNPAARGALKHCASPCFPSNASPDDIQALQAMLASRASQGLDTDLHALNEFLYQHRSAADLGDIIARLHADFDQTMAALGNSPLSYPGGWEPGAADRPLMLVHIEAKFAAQGLPNGLLNGIMATLHGHPDANNLIGALNTIMSRRGRDSNLLHIERLLYGLSDSTTAATSTLLLSRMYTQSERMRPIMERISIAELASLPGTTFRLDSPDSIAQLEVIALHTDATTAADIMSLVNGAGYPPPASGGVNPDLARLIEILRRNPVEPRLSLADVLAQIQQLNTQRDAVSQGQVNLPYNQADVRNSGTERGAIVGDLLHYLDRVLIHGDQSQTIADRIASATFGTDMLAAHPDFDAFVTATEVMRDQYRSFVEQLVQARRGTAPTAAEVSSIVNSTWNPKRGDFFEMVAASSLRMAFGDTHVFGEYRLNADGSGTLPDNTLILDSGTELRVVFFEYKTGDNSTSSGQSALQTLVESRRPDLFSRLGFGTTGVGADVWRTIREAERAGRTIRFDYRVISENPG